MENTDVQVVPMPSDGGFRARSLTRDADTDRNAVKSVADAINLVLEQAETERAGLKRRMDDVTSRAAVVGGNDADEFLTRTEDRSEMLRRSDDELKRGKSGLVLSKQTFRIFDFSRPLCGLAILILIFIILITQRPYFRVL
jgi:hypothetical protein